MRRPRELQTPFDGFKAFAWFTGARLDQQRVVEILPDTAAAAEVNDRGGFLAALIDHKSDATHI